MPFIRRNAEGTIDSLHRRDEGGAEFLPEEHPEVRAFLTIAPPDEGRAAAAAAADPEPERTDKLDRFAELDADFVRVIEDVIDALISRNLLNITDLPVEAQTKLFSRKSFRQRANKDALKLFGD